ncbi:MAG TPA: copper resistance protein NlpE N-terminal domain-containing protein [Chitinophagales bacterium]|nr:hypothetical protein [Bacteroidota bacterium]HAE34581.1 hypothetical protein [Bacteroidota bacterium]HPE98023.1 copper resistance protein NlpE N-terminal domain-containing protein [Chitinophagales bacterium]HQU75789.1 copper resistance protein NlpE N-terminal domain-containing protein [Chitinophagales bacterium]HRX24184.1 copper resistance protein NlpE N-terminal domain-containing protein [Chitinophagales bacterium]
MKRSPLYLLLLLIVTACGGQQHLPPGIHYPATFAAIIPCDDCSGIKYELTLDENMTFTERMIYIGKDDKIYQQNGSWYMVSDSVLLLEKKQGSMNQFLVEQGDLRMLDTHGKRFGGALADRYLLMPGSLSGLISPSSEITSADAGLSDFRATGSDPDWTLEIDFARHIIFRLRGEPEWVMPLPYMHIDSGFQLQYSGQGDRGAMHIVLLPKGCETGFQQVRVTAGQKTFNGCGQYENQRAQLNGYWVLHELNGKPVESDGGRTIPHCQIDIGAGTISGHTGCNQFNGPVTITRNTFQPGNLAMTKMACPKSPESALVSLLNVPSQYRFDQGQWQMIVNGNIVARWIRPDIQ